MPTKNEMAATMSRTEAIRAGVAVFDNPNDVGQVIAVNNKKLYGFRRKMLPSGLPTEPRLYIYSVSMYGELVSLGPGFRPFEVKPCPEGEEVGPPCVIDALYFQEEAKIDETEHNPYTGQQMADAVMRTGPGQNPSWDRRKQGWFVSHTNPPSQQEIAQATATFIIECKSLLAQGNQFANANQLTEINETHRRAAQYLKQKVDWDKALSKMVDCIGCGEPVKSGAIVHACATGVLCVQPGMWDKAISSGMKKLADAPPEVQKAHGYVEKAAPVPQITGQTQPPNPK